MINLAFVIAFVCFLISIIIIIYSLRSLKTGKIIGYFFPIFSHDIADRKKDPDYFWMMFIRLIISGIIIFIIGLLIIIFFK